MNFTFMWIYRIVKVNIEFMLNLCEFLPLCQFMFNLCECKLDICEFLPLCEIMLNLCKFYNLWEIAIMLEFICEIVNNVEYRVVVRNLTFNLKF